MPRSTMTSKGQITMPIEIRRALDLGAGDKVDFVAVEGGGYLIVPVRCDVRSLKGRFAGRVARPVSIDEMEDAIAAGAARQSRVAG